MSGLTESYIISDLLNKKNNKSNYENNKNNDNNNNNNKWYDRVYLCIEKDKQLSNYHVKGFNCKLFNSFEMAEQEAHKMKTNNPSNKDNRIKRMTIIPHCKWMPCIFDKIYLRYKLKEMYWSNDITLYRKIKNN